MKIEVLFPEICNLYGDNMNVTYLAACVPGTEIISTELSQKPAFPDGSVDIVYMGPMPEYGQELAVKALLPYKEAIAAQIEAGKVFLITGNALEIFGEKIETDDGSSISCLGLFPTIAKRRMLKRYSGLWLGKFGEVDIVGFKAQFAHSFGTVPALFDSTKGLGLDGTAGSGEGIRKNNFCATYLIGPVCPLNPPFALWLLKQAGAEHAVAAFEKTAMEAYNVRVKEFNDPAVKVN